MLDVRYQQGTGSLGDLDHPVHGTYSQLVNCLLNTDEASFCNLGRMDLAALEDVLAWVELVK